MKCKHPTELPGTLGLADAGKALLFALNFSPTHLGDSNGRPALTETLSPQAWGKTERGGVRLSFGTKWLGPTGFAARNAKWTT
jgi:hypothetical protein